MPGCLAHMTVAVFVHCPHPSIACAHTLCIVQMKEYAPPWPGTEKAKPRAAHAGFANYIPRTGMEFCIQHDAQIKR